jgi:hypothetical protein
MERVKAMKIKNSLTGKSRKAMGGEGVSVRVQHHLHLQFAKLPRKKKKMLVIISKHVPDVRATRYVNRYL